MRKKKLVIAIYLMFLNASPAVCSTIIGSKHDLKATSSPSQTCAFCHTPHNGNTGEDIIPLWNRMVSTQTFTPYSSPTMQTTPSASLSGVTKLCMGCHDGVVSETKHTILRSPGGAYLSVNCIRCHNPRPNDKSYAITVVGTNLTDDHPVSMTYPTALQDPCFNIPPDLQNGWGADENDVKLRNGKIECISCHNVHNPAVAPFLRKTNANSALCLTCHLK